MLAAVCKAVLVSTLLLRNFMPSTGRRVRCSRPGGVWAAWSSRFRYLARLIATSWYPSASAGLAFACKIESNGRTDEILQGLFVDLFALMDVHSAANVSFKAGVEKTCGIRKRGSLGEGQLDDGLVCFPGADDSGMRKDRRASPLYFLKDVRIGSVDDLPHPGEHLATPVPELFNLC